MTKPIDNLNWYNHNEDVKDILKRLNALEGKVLKCKVKITTDLLTSGTLVKGKKYSIATVEAGDNFSNVGYVDNNIFIATATTPLAWTNGTEVLEYIIEIDKVKDSFDKEINIDVVDNGILTFTSPKSEFKFDNIYLSDTFNSVTNTAIVDDKTIETDIQFGNIYKYYTIEYYD